MTKKSMFIDIAYNSLKKYGEELCGDKVEVFKSDDRVIIVMADGLGSGVKANILATLTSKIAITMLKAGESLEEVIETLIATLPVCQVRKIAYSTFSIIEFDEDLHCRIVESDNPPFVFLRNGESIKTEKTRMIICDKSVEISNIQLQQNDMLYVFSDGVVHAGIGKCLNLGWTHDKVEGFIKENSNESNAAKLSANLLNACKDLYVGAPGDDTTVISLKVREPVNLLVFTGPPINPQLDAPFVKMFMKSRGRKVVCGGTVANIISRELQRPIETTLDYIDKDIPPVGKIDGVDLVTEGVITLNRVVKLIEMWKQDSTLVNLQNKDAATCVFKMLMEDCTNIDIWVGKAVNEAHQVFNFPSELSLKINVVKRLENALRSIGKVVQIRYISEINYQAPAGRYRNGKTKSGL